MKKPAKKILSALTAAVMLALCTVTAGAKSNGLLYYGDMNMDSFISPVDIVMLNQTVLGLSNPTGDNKRIGDIDKSNAVNSTDVLLLNQHIKGINAITSVFQEAMWTDVPLTSAKQIAAGLEGGEGCQWPLYITFSETDGNLAFLGIDVGGLYRSTDGGKTWALSTIGLAAEGATGIVTDPNNGNRVLLCGVNGITNRRNGLYLSTDAGITWTGVNLNDSVYGHRDYRESIAFDKSSYSSSVGGSAIAYWLTEWGQLYKTTNGGTSWSSIANTDDYANGEIAVNPSNGYVYIASSTGFYRSTDKGASFEKKNSTAFTGIDVVGTKPNNVYLSSTSGLYISTDSGNSFTVSKGSNYPPYAYRIEVSPADPNYMMVSDDKMIVDGSYNYNKVYYSHDGGKSWTGTIRDTSMSIIPYNIHCESMSWHPTDKNICLTTGGDMVMRSTDGCKNLKWSNSGNSGACTTGLSVNVNNPAIMCASNQDYSGFYTTDYGKTWKYISWYAGWGGFTYGGYAVDKDHVVTINKIDDAYYIYYTDNGGKTVTNTDITVSNRYRCVTGVPGDNNIVLCNNYRSADKGITWTQMNGCAAVFDSNPNNGYLYGVNDSNQPVISTDKGVTWKTVGSFSGNSIIDMEYDIMGNRLVFITENYARIYAINCSTGSVSTVKDLSSTKDGYGEGLILRCIEVDPKNSNRIYVGNARHIFASDTGVLMTEDGGTTWTNLTSTVNNIYPGADGGREVDFLTINHETRILYAVGMCRGIYKTTLPEA